MNANGLIKNIFYLVNPQKNYQLHLLFKRRANTFMSYIIPNTPLYIIYIYLYSIHIYITTMIFSSRFLYTFFIMRMKNIRLYMKLRCSIFFFFFNTITFPGGLKNNRTFRVL